MPDEPRETETTDGDAEGERTSQLDDSLDDLQHLFGGIAARLLGPRAARRMDIDPEKPVISPEVDRAIGSLGDSVGRFLTQAGGELRRAAGQPAPEPPPTADEAPPEPELEGWSPLVLGARTFAESVGAVATELVEKMAPPKPPHGEE